MRAAWLLILTSSLHAGVVLHPPPPYFENAAQDAKGIIWSFSRAEYNRVYCCDGQGWTEQAAPVLWWIDVAMQEAQARDPAKP